MKDNLVIILLFGVLVTISYFVFSTSGDQIPSSDLLFSEKFLDETNSIKIQDENKSITLSKASRDYELGLGKKILEKQWLVTEPGLFFPKYESLNQLFLTLSHLKILHQVKFSSLQEYGLLEPKITLTLSSSSKEMILEIGSVNPVSKRRYVKFKNKEQIYLVEEAHISSLLKLALVEDQPFKLSLEKLSKLQLEGSSNLSFIKKDTGFELEFEPEADSLIIEKYISEILSIKARKSLESFNISSAPFLVVSVDWSNQKNESVKSKIEFFVEDKVRILARLVGSQVIYEFGPEVKRQLVREPISFLSRRLLRKIVLDDLTSSCLNINNTSLTNIGKCQLEKSLLEAVQEIFIRTEVLDLELLPGRLMMSSKPECRLKLNSQKIMFEIGARVNGEVDGSKDSPRYFVSDIGTKHYRGIISGIVAKDFCDTLEKLCSEARRVCAG